jgi:hypothetical protein
MPVVTAFLLLFGSSRALAQVGPAPVILVQPLDQVVLNGGIAVFQVVPSASLTPISYRWFHNGAVIPGATNSTHLVSNARTNEQGTYQVELKNTSGTTLSRVASLTVVSDLLASLNIRSARRVAKGFELQVTGPLLTSYIFQSSTNGSNWLSLSTNFTATGTATYVDPVPNNPVRMYRALLYANGMLLEENASGGRTMQLKSQKKGSQSFRHGLSGESSYSIKKIVLRVSRDSAAPNANLNFSIGTGINSGTIANTSVAISPTSITNTSGGSTFSAYEIVLPNPVGPFTAGTTYYLNFECEASNGRRFYLETANNAYADGRYHEGGSNTGEDLRFEIWGF